MLQQTVVQAHSQFCFLPPRGVFFFAIILTNWFAQVAERLAVFFVKVRLSDDLVGTSKGILCQVLIFRHHVVRF